jgi:DNA invertase Pin-like site-specific DNA recombinase
MGQRAALYLRVSTDGQTTENQRLVLAEVAGHRGWAVVATYDDQGLSGAGARERRPGFDRMLKDAGRRRFDILMVAAIDRLGRSTATVSTALADLSSAGTAIYSHREGLDGTTAYGRAMLNMASVFAELEHDLIRDRVRAGLARARAEGRCLGRPRVPDAVRARVVLLRAGGTSLRGTAQACGIALSTVQDILAEQGCRSEVPT